MHFILLHNPDDESGEIVFAGGEIAGMLCGFPADQRTSRLPATAGDAAPHGAGYFDIELTANKVVQEKQRLCPLGQDIVHAHSDEIDADGVVNAAHERDLELGSNAVCGGNSHRMTITATF